MQTLSSTLFIGAAISAQAFSPSPPTRFHTHHSTGISLHHWNTKLHLSMPDDDYPSDYDLEDLESNGKSVSVDMGE